MTIANDNYSEARLSENLDSDSKVATLKDSLDPSLYVILHNYSPVTVLRKFTCDKADG